MRLTANQLRKIIKEELRRILNEDIEDVVEPLNIAAGKFESGDPGAVWAFADALDDLKDYLTEYYSEEVGYDEAMKEIEVFENMVKAGKVDDKETVKAQMNAIMDAISFANPSY